MRLREPQGGMIRASRATGHSEAPGRRNNYIFPPTAIAAAVTDCELWKGKHDTSEATEQESQSTATVENRQCERIEMWIKMNISQSAGVASIHAFCFIR